MRISDWSSDVCSSDLCVDRLENRKAFGKVLGQFQHWQFRMAERATGIENARNLYLKAALRKDSGIAFPEPEAGMAKYYATEMAGEFAREDVQIFGWYGSIGRADCRERVCQ